MAADGEALRRSAGRPSRHALFYGNAVCFGGKWRIYFRYEGKIDRRPVDEKSEGHSRRLWAYDERAWIEDGLLRRNRAPIGFSVLEGERPAYQHVAQVCEGNGRSARRSTRRTKEPVE